MQNQNALSCESEKVIPKTHVGGYNGPRSEYREKSLLNSLMHQGKMQTAQNIASGRSIHMNGRVYDYNLGRFLSVDPYIQGTNSQAINPYSYLQNNPLSGTDPSGYKGETENCDIDAGPCPSDNSDDEDNGDDDSDNNNNKNDNNGQQNQQQGEEGNGNKTKLTQRQQRLYEKCAKGQQTGCSVDSKGRLWFTTGSDEESDGAGTSTNNHTPNSANVGLSILQIGLGTIAVGYGGANIIIGAVICGGGAAASGGLSCAFGGQLMALGTGQSALGALGVLNGLLKFGTEMDGLPRPNAGELIGRAINGDTGERVGGGIDNMAGVIDRVMMGYGIIRNGVQGTLDVMNAADVISNVELRNSREDGN